MKKAELKEKLAQTEKELAEARKQRNKMLLVARELLLWIRGRRPNPYIAVPAIAELDIIEMNSLILQEAPIASPRLS